MKNRLFMQLWGSIRLDSERFGFERITHTLRIVICGIEIDVFTSELVGTERRLLKFRKWYLITVPDSRHPQHQYSTFGFRHCSAVGGTSS
jgi:hypothetical protein